MIVKAPIKYPYFEKADVAGFTATELDAVVEVFTMPGWAVIKKYLGAIMEPVRPAVYANTDPTKQLMLQQGLGAIYVAANLEEFVSSAQSQADLLMQREQSAREHAEQPEEGQV